MFCFVSSEAVRPRGGATFVAPQVIARPASSRAVTKVNGFAGRRLGAWVLGVLLLGGAGDLPTRAQAPVAAGGGGVVGIDPIDPVRARRTNPVAVTGKAASGEAVIVRAVDADGTERGRWSAQANDEGNYRIAVDRSQLPAGRWLTLQASAGREEHASADDEAREAKLFVFPVIDPGATLTPVTARGRDLMLNGRPWGFAGLNYTRFLIEFSIRGSFERVVEDLQTHADWGISVLRIPLHLGMIQPAPGVFPDDPRHADLLKAHGLNPAFHELLEYFIALSGHHGMRVVFDWHEMPTDPYRYFVGGNHHDKGSDRPGKGIAWLFDQGTGLAADATDPRFVQAIVDTNRWLARRFRGNGNILGFEAPYNEPHSINDSSDSAWRRLAAATAWAVRIEDPERLTFGMPPAWGHNNVLTSVTWQLPESLSGMAPHYYLGNGPVALRADAPERKEPWLARDVAATFDHSFAAVAMPHSAAPYPVWNGESGEHGYASFLPDLPRDEAASLMIEAQLVQAYAAGMVGSLGWTLTGHDTVYAPLMEIYGAAYRRFAPVYRAGPVDYHGAQVLFVQNPAAEPVRNGLNHACVPFARLALDLHLAPVHYMTDDQLLANGLIQMAVGLEQVEEVASGLTYRAAVADTRNMDARTIELLENSKIPVLWVDDADQLTPERLGAFLAEAGVSWDRKTSPELQLIKGPRHLLVYRRSGDGPARVYPHLDEPGAFRLIGEDGATVFEGTAVRLADEGLDVEVPRWRSAIFTVEPRT